jgi:hypothetical protein
MNINEIDIGDYAETSNGLVSEVVAKENGYVALKGKDGSFWVTHNKIVSIIRYSNPGSPKNEQKFGVN